MTKKTKKFSYKRWLKQSLTTRPNNQHKKRASEAERMMDVPKPVKVEQI